MDKVGHWPCHARGWSAAFDTAEHIRLGVPNVLTVRPARAGVETCPVACVEEHSLAPYEIHLL